MSGKYTDPEHFNQIDGPAKSDSSVMWCEYYFLLLNELLYEY